MISGERVKGGGLQGREVPLNFSLLSHLFSFHSKMKKFSKTSKLKKKTINKDSHLEIIVIYKLFVNWIRKQEFFMGQRKVLGDARTRLVWFSKKIASGSQVLGQGLQLIWKPSFWSEAARRTGSLHLLTLKRMVFLQQEE